MAGDFGAASTAAVAEQIPLFQLIPVASDDLRLAERAIGAAAGAVMDVASIDVVQSFGEGDLSGASERGGRRGGMV